jgi:DNA-binding response OmpR family regulator
VQALIGETIKVLTKLSSVAALDTVANLAGRRAYVVENDQALCDHMCAALRSAGFVVDATLYASSAIAELAGTDCDVILMDAQLPEFDGFELHDCIRGGDQHAKTPIIIATEGAAEPGRAPGATFIAKDCSPEELALRALIEVVKAQVEPA